MPIATTDEQLALQASIREWAKRAGTVDAVRGMEPGTAAEDRSSREGGARPDRTQPDRTRPDKTPPHGARPDRTQPDRTRPDKTPPHGARPDRTQPDLTQPDLTQPDGARPDGTQPDRAAERWAGLAELGVFAIGLPAAAGGAGGSTADLAAALAQLTESLAPGPVLPTLIARLVLAGCPDQPSARQALPALASGRVSVAVAVEPGNVTGAWQPGGSMRLDGRTGPVLGGGTGTHLLLRAAVGSAAADSAPAGSAPAGSAPAGQPGEVWCLLPASRPGMTVTPLAAADFSRQLADVTLDGVTAAAADVLAAVSTERVEDLTAALFAVEAAAIANWCARTAAEYAAIRYQFGRPIGSFQAVKHLCASMRCRAEAAAALAADAAGAVDEAPDELPLAAAAAAAFNLDTAVDAAKDLIQVLGGIGFTWDHDAHLYLRRAVALRQLLGGSARWRDRAATLAAGGARRHLRIADAAASAELTAARNAARELAARISRLPADAQRQALADSGYGEPTWPPPYGLGASSAERVVIDDELNKAGITRPDLVIGGWAVPAILAHGTRAQAARFAGPTLRGEITWCQLFSEPEAGSDLASLRTRADRGDGGWLLTGQKVWTSLATQADWAICLARTDPAAPKHDGLTCFLVAMDSPGIDIRPLRELTGRQMFNQVFLDQVVVPDDCVVGAPGEGWRVARTTLGTERVAMGTGSSVGEAVERLLRTAARTGADNDPVARQRLGALIAEGMAVSLLDLQAVRAQLRGADAGPLAAVRKLIGTGHRQAAAEAALELAGTAAVAAPGDCAAGRDDPGADALQEFLLTRCLSIAGGTTQILLSLVGERLLGLPREEAR